MRAQEQHHAKRHNCTIEAVSKDHLIACGTAIPQAQITDKHAVKSATTKGAISSRRLHTPAVEQGQREEEGRGRGAHSRGCCLRKRRGEGEGGQGGGWSSEPASVMRGGQDTPTQQAFPERAARAHQFLRALPHHRVLCQAGIRSPLYLRCCWAEDCRLAPATRGNPAQRVIVPSAPCSSASSQRDPPTPTGTHPPTETSLRSACSAFLKGRAWLSRWRLLCLQGKGGRAAAGGRKASAGGYSSRLHNC